MVKGQRSLVWFRWDMSICFEVTGKVNELSSSFDLTSAWDKTLNCAMTSYLG